MSVRSSNETEGILKMNKSEIDDNHQQSQDMNRFKLYFETVNDPILVFEVNEDFVIEKLIDINSITLKKLGYSMKELESIQVWREVGKKIFKEFLNYLEEIKKEGYVVFDSVAITKQKTEIPIELNVRSANFNNKNIIIVIARDITEQMELNRKLVKQKEELSEFAHTTAHNLKNPLIAINGYIKLLEKNYNQNYLEKITNLTKKMVNMIERSLQIADSGSVLGPFELIDLNRLFQNVLETINPKNIDIQIDSLPKIKGSLTKLSVLFENLFNNVILHGKPSKILISCKTSSKSHIIDITNNGKVFDPVAKKKAFKERFTTRSEGYGGYGLLIIQKIIEAHNWKIKLMSNNKETKFTITIPKS